MYVPRTINQGFVDFHERLTPTVGESEAAKTHRASIEACLKAHFDLVRFFRTGSFGNGTSIAGYSDVDYFASIPTANLKLNSDTSLRMVRDTLDIRFPNTGVRVDCPAVIVPFGSSAQGTTEVVPGDYQGKTAEGHYIYDIPDGNGTWMKASPDAHNAYVRDVNVKFSGKVKPLIRFLKAWKYYNNVPISSFYLELRVAKYADGEKTILYSYDIKNIFKFLYDNAIPSIQDPAGISGYIYPASTQNQINEIYSKVSTALTRAQNAVNAEKEEKISDAFYWWNLIFGSNFPSYYY